MQQRLLSHCDALEFVNLGMLREFAIFDFGSAARFERCHVSGAVLVDAFLGEDFCWDSTDKVLIYSDTKADAEDAFAVRLATLADKMPGRRLREAVVLDCALQQAADAHQWAMRATGSALESLDAQVAWPSEVVRGCVWLSGWAAASDERVLRALSVRALLTVSDDAPALDSAAAARLGVKTLRVPLADADNAPLLEALPQCLAFAAAALSARQCLLLHCTAGRSRSVAVAVALLMTLQRCDADTAIARLRRLRPGCAPNAGFVRQLRAFQPPASFP